MNEIIITQANYFTTAVKKEQYPDALPEIAFIGRSNAGKSSLINSLTRVKNLARVSSQPGKTRTINFFEVGIKKSKAEERMEFYLVDLPGYGYAKVGRDARKSWSKFIQEYFLSAKDLRFVCQLMDIRHEPSKEDLEQFRFFLEHDIPVLIIATKADKIGKTLRNTHIAKIKKALAVPEISVLPYSSLKNEGRSDLLDVIYQSLLQ